MKIKKPGFSYIIPKGYKARIETSIDGESYAAGPYSKGPMIVTVNAMILSSYYRVHFCKVIKSKSKSQK